MDSSISFGATPLQKTKIKKYMIFPKTAHIVVLDRNNSADIRAMEEVKDTWKIGDYFGYKIVDNFVQGYKKKKNPEFFQTIALTTQSSNFETLESAKILGLAEFSDCPGSEYLEIEFLQAKPGTNSSDCILRKYKRIGKAILNYFKSQYSKIRLISVDSAEKFYEANGFIAHEDSRYYTWQR